MTSSAIKPRRMLRNEFASLFFDCLAAPAPAVQTSQEPELAHALVADACRERASDIHLEPQTIGTQIRFRIDGAIYDVATVTPPQGRLLANQFKTKANLDPIVRFTPKDGHATFQIDGSAVDLRLAIAPAAFGETISIRLLEPRRLERSMRELGLKPESLALLEDWVDNSNGLFLAAGPTGCGKTTTLYALLHELKFADRVILSVEDPVEYSIDGIAQIQIDQLHGLDFATAVKAMLRLDPDYLMVGEIRDQASAQSAVNAAIRGRILLSTIHSRDAVGAVTALRNWTMADHEIAESLSVVVAQRLVRKLCPTCRVRSKPSANDASWITSLGLRVPERVWEAKGCRECRQLGYLGREGIFELWRLDESDYDLILKHVDEHALRRHLHQKGHATLVTNGLAKVGAGITTLAELRRATAGWYGPQMTSSSAANEMKAA